MLLTEGTKVLVLREFAQKLPIGLNYKISPQWQEATILDRLGQRVRVRTLDTPQEIRVVNRRFIRPSM